MLKLLNHVFSSLEGVATKEEATQRVVQLACRRHGWWFGRGYKRSEKNPEELVSLDYSRSNSVVRPPIFSKQGRASILRGQGLPLRVLETGKAAWESVLKADLQLHGIMMGPEGEVHTMLGFPVYIGGKTTGVLVFIAVGEVAPSEDVVDAMDEVGLILGLTFERLRMKRDVEEGEARIRTILDSAAEAIITISPSGLIQTFNHAAEALFGHPASDAVGKNVNMLMPPPFTREHNFYLRNYLTTGRKKILGAEREVVGRRRDGSVFPMSLHVSEIFAGDRRLFTGIVRDLTERKQMEAEVATIASLERQRIGHELHDNIGQTLTGIALLAQALQRRLADASHSEAERAGDVVRGVSQTLEQLRALARGLAPADIGPGDLPRALEEFCVGIESLHGIACGFKCDQPVRTENAHVATQMLLIAREAVTNAVKHAQPKRIEIELRSDNGNIDLMVRDDGNGIPLALSPRKGMGLRIMGYRANVIGATLRVEPLPEGGTLVHCAKERER